MADSHYKANPSVSWPQKGENSHDLCPFNGPNLALGIPTNLHERAVIVLLDHSMSALEVQARFAPMESQFQRIDASTDFVMYDLAWLLGILVATRADCYHGV
jgi:hypothetical protein